MIALSKISGKYVGKKFNVCSCMDLLYEWYSDLGVDVPSSFENLNLNNYFKAWEIDKKKTIEVLLRLLKSIGSHAEITDLQTHDLVAIQEENNIYPAIYINNGMVVTSSLHSGVRVVHLGRNHKVIVNRRLL